jgi:hypothetical protein
MGQYYNPCFLNENKNQVETYFGPWDTDNGSKLMEHSYVGNSLVMNVSYHMIHSPKRLVWAGDYADEVVGKDNFYNLCNNAVKQEPIYDVGVLKSALNHNTYYINHDKKEYFDICKTTIPNMKGWSGIAHPLPILTADGNGRGGGDYEGVHMELVGTWKGDLIEVSDTIPADYTEIEPFFTEMNDAEIEDYMNDLNGHGKIKFRMKVDYATSEEFVVEAYTKEEAIRLAEDRKPDKKQVYENLTINVSPRIVRYDD